MSSQRRNQDSPVEETTDYTSQSAWAEAGAESSGDDSIRSQFSPKRDTSPDSMDIQVLRYPDVIWLVLIGNFFFGIMFQTIKDSSPLVNEFVETSQFYTVLCETIVPISGLIGAYISDAIRGPFQGLMYILPLIGIADIALLNSKYIGTSVLQPVGLIVQLICLGICIDFFAVIGFDQFRLPEEREEVHNFSIFHYFFDLLGRFCGRVCMALLHFHNICNPRKLCLVGYLLIILVLFLLAIWLVTLRTRLLFMREPNDHTRLKPLVMIHCLFHAVYHRIRNPNRWVKHWLDRSLEKFGEVKVREVGRILQFIMVISVVPTFFAIRLNQAELWHEVSKKMNSTVGNTIIEPYHIHRAEDICKLIWTMLYWLSIKGALRTFYPLQLMVAGQFICFGGLVYSTVIAFIVEDAAPLSRIPTRQGQLRFYNPTRCDISIYCMRLKNSLIEVHPMNFYEFQSISVTETIRINASLFTICGQDFPSNNELTISESKALGYIFRQSQITQLLDDPIPHADCLPKFRIISNALDNDTEEIEFVYARENSKTRIGINDRSVRTMTPGTYSFDIGDGATKMVLYTGGVTVLLVNKLGNKGQRYKFLEVTSANTVSIFNLIPQYLILFLGDVLFSINATRLAYTEAPKNLKMTYLALLASTRGTGAVISYFFRMAFVLPMNSQHLVFITLIVLVFSLVFLILSVKYVYVDPLFY